MTLPTMAAYPDGAEICPGDSVAIHHGIYRGRVQQVIESATEQARWNLDEAGVMIDTSFGGLVFYPMAALADGEVCLIYRGGLDGRAAEAVPIRT